MGVQVEMLGSFRVIVNGRPLPEDAWRRHKARQLLKCLLSRPRHRAPRDLLYEWLWPDSHPDVVTTTLRTTIHALRSTLADAGLVGDPGLVVVDHDTVSIASIA